LFLGVLYGELEGTAKDIQGGFVFVGAVVDGSEQEIGGGGQVIGFGVGVEGVADGVGENAGGGVFGGPDGEGDLGGGVAGAGEGVGALARKPGRR
jgi:hypothetical protein